MGIYSFDLLTREVVHAEGEGPLPSFGQDLIPLHRWYRELPGGSKRLFASGRLEVYVGGTN